jgi:hypothetical protein
MMDNLLIAPLISHTPNRKNQLSDCYKPFSTISAEKKMMNNQSANRISKAGYGERSGNTLIAEEFQSILLAAVVEERTRKENMS